MAFRNLIGLSILSMFISGCSNSPVFENMTGWYTMEEQVFTANGEETTIDQGVQKKVYTDEYYAYTNMREDSTASFGFGFYTFKDNILTENNIFSTSLLDTAQSFQLKITPHEIGYRQEIPEIIINGIPNKLVEEYTKINFSNQSEIDGVWKLAEYYTVSNGDTTRYKRDQYKIFQGGYFMFVQYYVDSITNVKHKGFGFGHFEFSSKELIETNIFSSFTANNGVPLQILIQKDSDTSFTQQIGAGSNNIAVEKYIRMPTLNK
ncbi:MAG: hypothetical protein RLZZ420_2303 [Bacteroidota bacterium]